MEISDLPVKCINIFDLAFLFHFHSKFAWFFFDQKSKPFFQKALRSDQYKTKKFNPVWTSRKIYKIIYINQQFLKKKLL